MGVQVGGHDRSGHVAFEGMVEQSVATLAVGGVQETVTVEASPIALQFNSSSTQLTIENKVIDYVGGQEDLRNRVLRAIGDANHRFEEDHLRLLRAIRFAAFQIQHRWRGSSSR